jgi:CTP synthase
VAPGFGGRGIEGKLEAVRFARENNIPFFGICLGMQCAVIEYARNVCGWKDANSTEFNESSSKPVIDLMDEQRKIEDKGGTMRLGAYECALTEGSNARNAYKQEQISERHRHRYELNNHLRSDLEAAGLRVTGVNPTKNLVEIVEIEGHPWFTGVQFHPELKSTVTHPHPLFVSFIAAALNLAAVRKETTS